MNDVKEIHIANIHCAFFYKSSNWSKKQDDHNQERAANLELLLFAIRCICEGPSV